MDVQTDQSELTIILDKIGVLSTNDQEYVIVFLIASGPGSLKALERSTSSAVANRTNRVHECVWYVMIVENSDEFVVQHLIGYGCSHLPCERYGIK